MSACCRGFDPKPPSRPDRSSREMRSTGCTASKRSIKVFFVVDEALWARLAFYSIAVIAAMRALVRADELDGIITAKGRQGKEGADPRPLFILAHGAAISFPNLADTHERAGYFPR